MHYGAVTLRRGGREPQELADLQAGILNGDDAEVHEAIAGDQFTAAASQSVGVGQRRAETAAQPVTRPGCRRRRRLLAAILLVTSLGWLLIGCGTSRSVAAYCQAFYGRGSQMRSQWSAQANKSGDLLGSLGTILGAPQQLANFFEQLDVVAPDDIEPDIEQLQQAAQQEADSMKSGNLMQGLLGGLMGGLGSQGAEARVNQWTISNCGAPPGG